MADLHAFVANFIACGHKATTYGNTIIRDSITFKCENLEIKFIQHKDFAIGKFNQFTGVFAKTTDVFVENVTEENLEKALKVIDKICWLLSFAGLSPVHCYGYEYPCGSKKKKIYETSDVSNFFRPVIDVADGRKIKEFVETSYLEFSRLHESRKLKSVIGYLVNSEKNNQPIEIILVLLFVTIENLKATFAKAKGIPYKNGKFMKDREKSYSFAELVNLMISEVGMKADIESIKNLRNEIIHSGLSEKTTKEQWEFCEKTHDLLREYILRLLGFHGEFLYYSSQ